MSEFSVWLRYPDGRTEKVADHVEIVQQDGREVILRWRQAEARHLIGEIQEIDTMKQTITIRPDNRL